MDKSYKNCLNGRAKPAHSIDGNTMSRLGVSNFSVGSCFLESVRLGTKLKSLSPIPQFGNYYKKLSNGRVKLHYVSTVVCRETKNCLFGEQRVFKTSHVIHI